MRTWFATSFWLKHCSAFFHGFAYWRYRGPCPHLSRLERSICEVHDMILGTLRNKPNWKEAVNGHERHLPIHKYMAYTQQRLPWFLRDGPRPVTGMGLGIHRLLVRAYNWLSNGAKSSHTPDGSLKCGIVEPHVVGCALGFLQGILGHVPTPDTRELLSCS